MPSTPPGDLAPVPLLVLSRVVVSGAKGIKRAQLVKDLAPLLGERWAGASLTERLDGVIEDLTTAGLVDRAEVGKGKSKALLLTPTDAGRSRALGALGLEALPPKATWGQIVGTHLAARALGLPAPTGAAAKAFATVGGFQAAVLRARHALPVPAFATLAQAQDALLWKLLGHPDGGKFDLKSVRAFLLARALGEARPAPEKEVVRRLIARDLRPRNSTPAELRAAAVRRWLAGAENETEVRPPETPAPPHVPTETPPPALPLDVFARRVVDAARTSRTGRFGDNKVFIAHVWRALRDDPALRGISLDGFKHRLAEANQARHLNLSRADLVEAMDPADVRDSETVHFGAHFHFIRF